jgi:hypothetical protein
VTGEAGQESDRRFDLVGVSCETGDQFGTDPAGAQDGGQVGGGHRAVGRQGGRHLLVGLHQEPVAQPLGRGPGQQRGQGSFEGFLPPPVGLGR